MCVLFCRNLPFKNPFRTQVQMFQFLGTLCMKSYMHHDFVFILIKKVLLRLLVKNKHTAQGTRGSLLCTQAHAFDKDVCTSSYGIHLSKHRCTQTQNCSAEMKKVRENGNDLKEMHFLCSLLLHCQTERHARAHSCHTKIGEKFKSKNRLRFLIYLFSVCLIKST